MQVIKHAKFHSRNRHSGSYDLRQLAKVDPELAGLIIQGPENRQTINFSDPVSVKALNRALLKADYGVVWWDIPPGSLCPPVPGRADYIHFAADLLASKAGGTVPKGSAIRVLDVGLGASCIYPIIGRAAYGWSFVGSDIAPDSLKSAQLIIQANPGLGDQVELRLQPDKRHIFRGVIREAERFDLTLCNPPFHASAIEAIESNQNRLVKMGLAKIPTTHLNFGGQAAELWCEGGEAGFIGRMIQESSAFAGQCQWFSCLVSRRESLAGIYRGLKKAGAREIRTIPMAQGQKISRFVAWTFQEAPTD